MIEYILLFFLSYRCQCGIFVEEQFPIPLAPLYLMNDTLTATDCNADLFRAGVECEEQCTVNGLFFDRTYNLTDVPPNTVENPVGICNYCVIIFSRQASLARQAFLKTALQDSHSKKGKKRLRQKVLPCNHM